MTCHVLFFGLLLALAGRCMCLGVLRAAAMHRADTPFPSFVPQWEVSFRMNRSTVAMPANESGFFDPELAAKFGLVSFDQGNARALWQPSMQRHAFRLPTSEELMVEQCRRVKAINPETKCFVYRNGELALQWLGSEAAQMYNATAAGLFLQTGDAIYNEPSGALDQYFFNFSNTQMRDFWAETVMFGPTAGSNPLVDGVFVDDSQSLGSEHADVVAKCHMNAEAVAQWNAMAAASYVDSWRRLVGSGRFVWNLFQDPDGNEAFTTGQAPPNPTRDNCQRWMSTACPKNYDHVALMMSPAGPQTARQSAAAFLILRGAHAFWGMGWNGGGVFYDEYLHQLDPGAPRGACVVADVDGGIFRRQYSKMVVTLDCSTFVAQFTPIASVSTLW